MALGSVIPLRGAISFAVASARPLHRALIEVFPGYFFGTYTEVAAAESDTRFIDAEMHTDCAAGQQSKKNTPRA